MARMTLSSEAFGTLLQQKNGETKNVIYNEELANYIFRLVEELNHVLTHLGGENISGTGMEDIRAGISANGIKTAAGLYEFDDSGIWYTDANGTKTKVVNTSAS